MGWGVGSTASWSWCIPRFIPLWFHPPQYKMLMLPQQTLGTCSKFACQDSMLASKTTLTLSLNALPWMLNWLCCVLLLKKAGRSYLCSMEKKWESIFWPDRKFFNIFQVSIKKYGESVVLACCQSTQCMVSHRQSTTRQSPSLSRSNTRYWAQL